jgi:hypothetical protein
MKKNNNVIKSIIIATTIYLIFVACNELSPIEKGLKGNLNKTIHLETLKTILQKNAILSFEEFRQKYKNISVVYLQNGCNPCYPKFIKWQQKMDSIEIPDNYTVLFIIKSNSYSEFMSNVLDINYVDDKFYTVLDPEAKFIEKNKDVPRWIIDSSILLDPENKIKMVGAPFATPEMTELFHKICKE